MNILAVDTTTKIASVALKNNDIIDERRIDNEVTHSEKLLPLIDEILVSNNITLNDIDRFACLNGPGSFTGIRIGLSTLKAFLQVQNKDCFAISSLEAIAISTYLKLEINSPKYIASLIDARNNRVYFSMFEVFINSSSKICSNNVLAISNLTIDEAICKISAYILENNLSQTDVILSGDAINKYTKIISQNFKCEQFCMYPTTKDLIYIEENISNIQDYMFNAFSLNAIYARLSQAERLKNNE